MLQFNFRKSRKKMNSNELLFRCFYIELKLKKFDVIWAIFAKFVSLEFAIHNVFAHLNFSHEFLKAFYCSGKFSSLNYQRLAKS